MNVMLTCRARASWFAYILLAAHWGPSMISSRSSESICIGGMRARFPHEGVKLTDRLERWCWWRCWSCKRWSLRFGMLEDDPKATRRAKETKVKRFIMLKDVARKDWCHCLRRNVTKPLVIFIAIFAKVYYCSFCIAHSCHVAKRCMRG